MFGGWRYTHTGRVASRGLPGQGTSFLSAPQPGKQIRGREESERQNCAGQMDLMAYYFKDTCLKPTVLSQRVPRPPPMGRLLSVPLLHSTSSLPPLPGNSASRPAQPLDSSRLSIYQQLCVYESPKHSLAQHGVSVSEWTPLLLACPDSWE